MMLERLFEKEKITIHSLHSHELTHLIQCALAKCKRTNIKKSETNCFPVNAWFDEECKAFIVMNLTHLMQCALAKCKRKKKLRSLKQIAFRLMLGLMGNGKRQGECGKNSLQAVIKQEKDRFHGFEGRTNIPWEK